MAKTICMDVDVDTTVSVDIDIDEVLANIPDEDIVKEAQLRLKSSDEGIALLQIYNNIILGKKEDALHDMHSYLRDKLERAL